MIDEWVRKKSKKKYDIGGTLASIGKTDELILNQALENFNIGPPYKDSLDIKDFDDAATITISNIVLPAGTETTIKGRDFVVANIQAPSGLKSSENESTDSDDAATDTIGEEKEETAQE